MSGDMLGTHRERRHLHVGFDFECLAGDTLVSGRSIAEVGPDFSQGGNVVHRRVCPVSILESVTRAPVHASAIASTGHPTAATLGAATSRERTAAYARLMVLRRSSGGAVAAVGVRMVPLGQFLVAHLHRLQRGRPRQAECGQRLAQLGRGLLGLLADPRFTRPAASRCSGSRSTFLVPGRGAAQPAERPGRALPRGVGAELRLDLARATCPCSSPRSSCRRAHAPGRTTSSPCRLRRDLGARYSPIASQPGMSQVRPGAAGSGA